jgi:hypothetical protein
MNQGLAKIGILASILLAPTPACALQIDLGPLDSNPAAFSQSFFRTGNDSGTALGPYIDTYLFSLSTQTTVGGNLKVVEGGRTHLSAALELTGDGLADPIVDDTLGGFSFPDLAPGSYVLSVQGTFSGLSGVSRYEGVILVGDAPPLGVPEPKSWALLVCGFGALGGLARARRLGSLTPPDRLLRP